MVARRWGENLSPFSIYSQNLCSVQRIILAQFMLLYALPGVMSYLNLCRQNGILL